MAPKKKETQKMSLGDFLAEPGFGGGSWADEVEETYVTGTQALPQAGRSTAASTWQDRGYSVRESIPTKFPDGPPYTAHLGNLSYDATNESLTAFFEGCDVISVRIIEDREMMRPKGFGYVEFSNPEGLKQALTLDGQSFEGRMIKIKVADPPRGGDARSESTRDLSDWSRKGPLPDIPGRSGRQQSDFGERRPPRDPATEGRSTREMTWERRGPLSPLTPQEFGSGSRDTSRAPPSEGGVGERGDSFRGNRRDVPTWGEGRQDDSRPPRREYTERPERADRPERAERAERSVTAAEKDMQWRDRMRPAPVNTASPDGSEAPLSPSATSAAPAQAPGGRPRLNLQKRTVPDSDAAVASTSADSKASPFGAARPIDTAAKEKEIEEKRQQAIQEKREADEKAKEDKRIAKEAAEAAETAAKAEAEAKENSEPQQDEEPKAEGEKQDEAAPEQKLPIRNREPREPKEPAPAPKSRAAEAGNWRSAPNSRGPAGGPRSGRDDPARGPRNDSRTPRSNGQQTAGEGDAPTREDDGWTTVATGGRKGRTTGRPLLS